MPGVVGPWTEHHPNLADDLGPHVQSNGRILPLCKRQRRPLVGYAIHVNCRYPRLMKSENERLTLSNMSRASSCVRWKVPLIRLLTPLKGPLSSSLS
jgi:hypothetical protein